MLDSLIPEGQPQDDAEYNAVHDSTKPSQFAEMIIIARGVPITPEENAEIDEWEAKMTANNKNRRPTSK